MTRPGTGLTLATRNGEHTMRAAQPSWVRRSQPLSTLRCRRVSQVRASAAAASAAPAGTAADQGARSSSA